MVTGTKLLHSKLNSLRILVNRIAPTSRDIVLAGTEVSHGYLLAAGWPFCSEASVAEK